MPSGSGQTARNFVFLDSQGWLHLFEESLSFGYLDQSRSTTIWNQNLPFWRNTNHPFLVLWRKGYFISTEVQQILLNLGFGGKADVLASSTGYELYLNSTEPWQVIIETESLLSKQLLEILTFWFHFISCLHWSTHLARI